MVHREWKHAFARVLGGFWSSAIAGLALFVAQTNADETTAIPNPLSLETALSFAGKSQPQINLARASLDSAALKLDQTKTGYQPTVYLDLVPRAAQRTADPDSDLFNDSFVRIRATQPIYDFGRTRAQRSSAQAKLSAQETLWANAKNAQQIEIIARYFDVLLADLRYLIDDEEMTLAFLRYDRLRERRELFDGESEVDVLEAETRYRELFVVRTNSQQKQQYVRLLLGNTLGFYGERPRDLEAPDLSFWLDREMPEYDVLVEKALQGNPDVLVARHRVASASSNVDFAKAAYNPSLYAEVELSEFERATGSRDDIRASLNLEIPIYQGSRKRVARSIAEIELEQARAELQLTENRVREQLFEVLQALQTAKLEKNAAEVRESYRDLYLDRSRALYEMEVRTDLGDAQAKLLEATWLSTRADFRIAANWAKLDALLGQPVTLQ